MNHLTFKRPFRLFCAAVCIVSIVPLGVTSGTGWAETEGSTYTELELQSIKEALDKLPNKIDGTGWGVESGRVVVVHDDSVTGDMLTALKAETAPYGDAIRFEHVPGVIGNMSRVAGDGPTANQQSSEEIDYTVGGKAIYPLTTGSCSLGFNVDDSAGNDYFITAGHCTARSTYWYLYSNNGTYLGWRYYSRNDTMDYGIVKYSSNVLRYGSADKYDGSWQAIDHTRAPQMSEFVCHSGKTSGKRCGYIRGTCETYTIGGQTRYCAIKTTACAGYGDSGGPLWHGTAALGIVVVGPGNCTTHPGGPTYYTRMDTIATTHGLYPY